LWRDPIPALWWGAFLLLPMPNPDREGNRAVMTSGFFVAYTRRNRLLLAKPFAKG
jgi:hypothetical protein